jgi:ribosome-interacting GTPase 1
MERLDTTCVHCIHVFDLNNLKSEFFEFKRVFCLDRDILLYKNRIQIKFSYRTQGGVHFHVCKQYITLTEVQLRTLMKNKLTDWSRNSETT